MRARCGRCARAITAVFSVAALSVCRAGATRGETLAPSDFAGTTSSYVMTTYDGDGDGVMSASELDVLFAALRSRMEGAAREDDDDDAHAHREEEEAHAAASLTPIDVIAAADGDGDSKLSVSEFESVCAGLLRCAADVECAFDTVAGEEREGASSDGGKRYVGFKCAMGAAILAEGLLGGLAPMLLATFLTSHIDQLLGLMNALSGGIFLAAGMTHILPHVIEASVKVSWSPSRFPLPYALVTLGYMLIFFVERVLFHTHGHSLEGGHDHGQPNNDVEGQNSHASHSHAHSHDHDHGHGHSHGGDTKSEKPKKPPMTSNEMAPYVLLIAISLHAILAGVSLGVQSTKNNIVAVAVAIMSHKAPAAFSIGFAFYKSGITSFKVFAPIILAFALVTPIGIALGAAIGDSSPVASLVLEGLAAGSFIYVGATEITTDEFETSVVKCDDQHGMQADAQIRHTHRVHEAPQRATRMQKFLAYCTGVGVILLAGLAPHVD